MLIIGSSGDGQVHALDSGCFHARREGAGPFSALCLFIPKQGLSLIHISTDENPFVGGGKIEDGRYLISSDERLFHGVRQGNNQVVFLRREFAVEKPVERAIVSAIGKDPDSIGSYTFKMYLNGCLLYTSA